MSIGGRVKNFFSKASVKGLLSTFILIIPTIISAFGYVIPKWCKILLIVVLLVINSINIYWEYRNPIQPKDILEAMVHSIWKGPTANHIRANVMLYDSTSKKLEVRYRYNMGGHIDRFLKIHPKRGCAGKTYHSKQPTAVDLNKVDHKGYLMDPEKVWKKMESILSVPIVNLPNTSEVIGVLNVDSDLEINEVGFKDQEIMRAVIRFADLISKTLTS